MKLHLYKPIRATRACGGCTACCTTCYCETLKKPINVRCEHALEGRGCAIYDEQPPECRNYQCAWLHGLLPEQFRPDKAGIVWNYQSKRASNGAQIFQAMLLRADITIEQVEYQFKKLQQLVAEPLVCEIIPAGLSCKLGGAFHCRLIRSNIYLADREA